MRLFIKVAIKMKTSPHHFSVYSTRGTVPDSRRDHTSQCCIVIDLNFEVIVQCMVEPWPSGSAVVLI